MIEEDRPKSPYHPDKTPYYRARYHSAPISPTGQNNKTTSTTTLPQRQVPAERDLSTQTEELQTTPSTLHISTQTLNLEEEEEEDEGEEVEIADSLDLEVETLTEDVAPVFQSQPAYYEPECDSLVSDQVDPVLKREEQLLTPPPLPERTAPDITLRGDNLYDPYHIGTTFVVLSRQNHGRFRFASPVDPNKSAPGSPKPDSRGSSNPCMTKEDPPTITPVVAAPVAAVPVSPVSPTSPKSSYRRPLYQPKSLNRTVTTSPVTPKPGTDLDTTPSKLEKPTNFSLPATQSDPPPPLPARNPGKPMTPDQRRGFPRPVKEPVYREAAVDAPTRPLLPSRRDTTNLLEQQRNAASREFHLQTIMDVERPGRLDTWSGAMPPPEKRGAGLPDPTRASLQSIPHVKLLGDEWKELAQRLGYENSHIALFARDFPDPGQAMLDHWSKQPDSRLDDLLRQLKFMDLWKTADTLDKTFDNTNV